MTLAQATEVELAKVAQDHAPAQLPTTDDKQGLPSGPAASAGSDRSRRPDDRYVLYCVGNDAIHLYRSSYCLIDLSKKSRERIRIENVFLKASSADFDTIPVCTLKSSSAAPLWTCQETRMEENRFALLDMEQGSSKC